MALHEARASNAPAETVQRANVNKRRTDSSLEYIARKKEGKGKRKEGGGNEVKKKVNVGLDPFFFLYEGREEIWFQSPT